MGTPKFASLNFSLLTIGALLENPIDHNVWIDSSWSLLI